LITAFVSIWRCKLHAALNGICDQGLTLVDLSAQLKHCLWDTLVYPIQAVLALLRAS
jgi:hypothetical protein